MKIRTFSADTMAQALAQVKRAIGANAVVLHTRTYKRGGLFGFGARTVIEVTAADGKQVGELQSQKAKQSPRRQALLQAARTQLAASPPSLPASPPPMPPMNASNANAGDLIKRTYQAARLELQKTKPEPAPAVATVAPMPSDQMQLAQEMREVKRMVARVMHKQSAAPKSEAGDMPDALFDQYRALIEAEVAEEIADEVVQQVRDGLDESQLADSEACRTAVYEAVKMLLPTPEALPQTHPAKQGRPRTIALIGPTGVGKTTTVAKLAANFKLRENKRVGLVTLDTYRIAAVEQLRTYAQIIGVPLRVVGSPNELSDAVATMADCDVVLIDTAGRSQRNGDRLEELGAMLDEVAPDEVHLVLSSTCTQAVLLEVVERFSTIRTDRVIFTKLDEAVNFGVLVNVLKQVDKQLSYVTTGQEVPHHIEPACRDRLASLLLGECGVEK